MKRECFTWGTPSADGEGGGTLLYVNERLLYKQKRLGFYIKRKGFYINKERLSYKQGKASIQTRKSFSISTEKSGNVVLS